MEKQNNFLDPKQTTKKWIYNKWAVVGDKVQLNKIKQGEFFLKDGLICYINITSKPYISYFDIIMREHCTSDTEQLVHTIKLVGEN